jgi:hypothetical protein
MKLNRIIQGLLVIVILQSCATKRLTEEGNSAYNEGNYESALEKWEQVIDKRESMNKKADAEIYFKAGLAAHKLDQTAKASEYLESAEYLEFNSPRLYATLAKIYKTIDNLSKEIKALESYHEQYPQGDQIDTITARLFETYVESENWDKAVKLWPEVEKQAQDNVNLRENYLIVNKNLENDEVSNKLAEQILEKDPENITALEWYAKNYFWKAENLYVKEMNAYKNNRTTSQYKKLLKAWDEVWPTFRKSRDYFKKLYRLDPKPEYAKFLRNIYTRMDKKQKAAYWDKRAK